MNTNASFDLSAARHAVALDTTGVLQAFFEGRFVGDESIGDATWSSKTSEFFAVRWRFDGRHVGAIPGFGHTEIAPTRNAVTVSGLTLVENRAPGRSVGADVEAALRAGSIVFHRFIDWMAVFAQLGVLHLGRPMSLDDIRMMGPTREYARRPGYNDKT